MKKELKQFKILSEYDYNLKNTQKRLFESFVTISEINRYSHRLSESLSMELDATNLTESGDQQNVLDLIGSNQYDVNNNIEFKNSLKYGNRGEFLSDYTEDEYGQMKTYKLKGYNIGFAIKLDGDIVSLHNNSGIGGLGGALVKSAVSLGGTKMDHFDGFLTGLYSKNGFNVVNSDQWNDDYSPSDWKYVPVDIFNPDSSIYANTLKKFPSENEITPELKQEINLYGSGMPDVVYRSL